MTAIRWHLSASQAYRVTTNAYVSRELLRYITSPVIFHRNNYSSVRDGVATRCPLGQGQQNRYFYYLRVQLVGYKMYVVCLLMWRRGWNQYNNFYNYLHLVAHDAAIFDAQLTEHKQGPQCRETELYDKSNRISMWLTDWSGKLTNRLQSSVCSALFWTHHDTKLSRRRDLKFDTGPIYS